MNRTLRIFSAAFLLSAVAAVAGDWMDNYDKALTKAKTEKKMVLLDFTGSDWCGWCIKLDKEVFSTPEFKKYAKDNLVLVEVDFPQGKHLTRKVQKQNEELKSKFSIKGFPTIIFLDPEGKQIGQGGYMEGGPKPFIDMIEKVKAGGAAS